MTREQAASIHDDIAGDLRAVRQKMQSFGGLYDASMRTLHAMEGRAVWYAEQTRRDPTVAQQEETC